MLDDNNIHTNDNLIDYIKLLSDIKDPQSKHDLALQLLYDNSSYDSEEIPFVDIKSMSMIHILCELGNLSVQEKATFFNSLPSKIVYDYLIDIMFSDYKNTNIYFDICFQCILKNKDLCYKFLFNEEMIYYSARHDKIMIINQFESNVKRYLLHIYQLYDEDWFNDISYKPIKQHILYHIIFGIYFDNEHYQIFLKNLTNHISILPESLSWILAWFNNQAIQSTIPNEWKDKFDSLFSLLAMKGIDYVY